jgi:hypothetical protein
MKYIFPKTGAEVQPERWGWGVMYRDGSELHQFGDDGIYHQIGEIDQSKIKLAALYKLNNPNEKILIPWKLGMKLIHKYVITHDIRQHAQGVTSRTYVFGYKDGNQHHYTYILPNDWRVYSNEANLCLTQFPLT